MAIVCSLTTFPITDDRNGTAAGGSFDFAIIQLLGESDTPVEEPKKSMVDVKNLTNVTIPPGKNELILQDASRIKAKTGKRMEIQTNAFGANTELSFPTQFNMNIMMKL